MKKALSLFLSVLLAFSLFATSSSAVDRVITVDSVDVNPGSIVETLAANVIVNVSSTGAEGEDIYVYLSADGNKLGKTLVPKSGRAVMRLSAAPAAGTYGIVAEVGNGLATASAPIEIVAYEPEKVWEVGFKAASDGRLEAKFYSEVTLTPGASAAVRGEAVGLRKNESTTSSLILDIPAVSLTGGDVVKIAGVKFPALFPSYNFTFTKTVHGPVAQWVGTWASAQYYGDTGSTDSGTRDAGTVALTLPNSTLRQMIRTSVAGNQLRLTFSNEYGATPMTLNSVSIAKANGRNNTSNVDVSTNTPVTFNGGNAGVTILPGQFVTSDVIDFPVAALQRIAVSTYFGDMPTRVSAHIAARGNSYLQFNTNSILNATISGTTKTNWFSLCSIDVLAPAENKSIVALGDSITDGYGVSNESYTRWVDVLMNNLQGNPDTSHLSVINMGIGTNALLSGTNPLAARSRFERDVLNQPGVGYVVFLIGVNDLPGEEQTAADMILAFDEMFKAAAAKGIKVYGGTISPRGSTAAQDANRLTVNNWMRQQYAEGNIDGLADFDELLRNPASQNVLLPSLAADSIHPNAAGYRAMGEYVYSLILRDLAP